MTAAVAVRSRSAVRTGLVVLACSQVVIGVWALIAPRSFYDGFPLPAHAWVALLPPYNEHLIRDVGGLSLAMTVLLGAAAMYLERRLARVAVLAFVAYTLPHALFHFGHLDGFSVVDAVAQSIGFVVQLGIPVVVLLLTRRDSRAVS